MSIQYGFKVKFSDHIMEDNIGQLLCTDVILARDGTYEYTSDDVFDDGKFNIVELHRDWNDVKKLRVTLEGKPVVYYHPDKKTDITVDNINDFRIGHVQNVRESKAEGYNVLIGDIFITDKEVIELVKTGKLREISLGYFYDVDDTQPNYLKQVNMIAEHVAIVQQGRAGVSKILDAAETYILARVRPNGSVAYVEYRDEKPKTGFNKWLALKEYGYYRFNQYIEFDQASRITLRTIGLMVKENPTSSFVVVNEQKKIIKTYYHTQPMEAEELIDKGYNLNEFEIKSELDPYDIPDENKDEPVEDGMSNKDIAALGLQIDARLVQADKDFRHFGDNYRGTAWIAFVKLLKKNAALVEAALNIRLPKDYYDDEYLNIAEDFVRYARDIFRKANDELSLNVLLATFDNEHSSLDFFYELDELKKFVKKQTGEFPSFENAEELIEKLNEIKGIYAINIYEFTPRIFVSKAINEDEVEVYICESVDELNKQLTEYFENFEEAYLKIKGDEEKYSKMSAFLI